MSVLKSCGVFDVGTTMTRPWGWPDVFGRMPGAEYCMAFYRAFLQDLQACWCIYRDAEAVFLVPKMYDT